MEPKISVLLPAYNHQAYIGATIESLLNQKERNIEIIAVDDGSTDRTGEILDRYAQLDSRLKVFHKANGGVVSALNYGLGRVNGTWIATCGSDDIVPEHAYSNFLKGEKDADILIGEFLEFDDEGRKTRVRLGHKIGNGGFEALFAMPATWNKLIRTQLVKENGIAYPDVRIGEDLIFLARLAVLNPKCKFIPRVVYEYRNNASSVTSMSHSYSLQTFQDHLTAREAVEQICTKGKIEQGGRYVYQTSLPYIANYIQHLSGEEQTAAVDEFRRFISLGESQIDEQQFEWLFAVPWKDFRRMSDEEYIQKIKHVTHEEWLLRKYRAGEIGLSFLVKCFRNWFAYKKGK